MKYDLQIPVIAENVPVYAHPGDAGADILSAENCVIAPGARALVGTGVKMALPDGYVAYVMPRSGLAIKQGVTVLNAPGVVDAGYRGELKVALINHGDTDFVIAPGDRIAQLVIMPVPRAEFVRVNELPDSERGEGGFGSTGVSQAL